MSKEEKTPPSEVIVKLDYPIKWGEGGLVDSVELKRPKGKHLRKLNRDVGMSQLLDIASKVSGYTPSFFDEMDASDCMKVTEAIQDFLDVGPETGETA